uniref:hypothetical protein n=1 Tax=Thiolapillus sp. TaxID=2017437 RepID=UPI003AF77399
LDAYFASPLALCARRVSSAASRLLGSTSLRFALHGWQRMMQLYQDFSGQIGHSGNPSQYRKYLPAYPSAPSPSLSQGQVPDGSLDGAWASQNRILLAIKQQYARMYWARDQYRDFYLEVLPEHLRFKDATTGQVQDFEFRMQDNQLALRDKKGRVIQFFRLNTAGESPAPAPETTPNFWDPNVN